MISVFVYGIDCMGANSVHFVFACNFNVYVCSLCGHICVQIPYMNVCLCAYAQVHGGEFIWCIDLHVHEVSMFAYVPLNFVVGHRSSCMWACGSLVYCIKWEEGDTEKIQDEPSMGEFCFQRDLVENELDEMRREGGKVKADAVTSGNFWANWLHSVGRSINSCQHNSHSSLSQELTTNLPGLCVTNRNTPPQPRAGTGTQA